MLLVRLEAASAQHAVWPPILPTAAVARHPAGAQALHYEPSSHIVAGGALATISGAKTGRRQAPLADHVAIWDAVVHRSQRPVLFICLQAAGGAAAPAASHAAAPVALHCLPLPLSSNPHLVSILSPCSPQDQRIVVRGPLTCKPSLINILLALVTLLQPPGQAHCEGAAEPAGCVVGRGLPQLRDGRAVGVLVAAFPV